MLSPIVVFDLDGTLVDTAPDLIETLNIVLRVENLPAMPFDVARNLIGGGARAMLERAIEMEGVSFPAKKTEQMLADFLDHYEAHIADRSRPFPGAERALRQLTEKGFRLAVCTNKLEGLSRKLLDALQLSTHFAIICGQDSFGIKKPDPLVWQKTLAAAGGDPRRAIMIGDSITDIDLARAAKVPVIAVDFGYTEKSVGELNPDRVISHFDELADAVAALLPH